MVMKLMCGLVIDPRCLALGLVVVLLALLQVKEIVNHLVQFGTVHRLLVLVIGAPVMLMMVLNRVVLGPCHLLLALMLLLLRVAAAALRGCQRFGVEGDLLVGVLGTTTGRLLTLKP